MLGDSGFRGTLFIATKNIIIQPEQIDDNPVLIRSLRGLGNLTDRPMGPFVFHGQPDWIQKHVFTITMGSGLAREDIKHLLWVKSLGCPFDICLWVYETESYSWPVDDSKLPLLSSNASLKSWRRNALTFLAGRTPDVIPAFAISDYPVGDVVDDEEGVPTVDTVADSRGRMLWTPHRMPNPSDGLLPNVRLNYVSLIRVIVDPATPPQESYKVPFVHEQQFVVREV